MSDDVRQKTLVGKITNKKNRMILAEIIFIKLKFKFKPKA